MRNRKYLLTLLPISYYAYKKIEINKNELRFCIIICLIDKNNCFSCFKHILMKK